MSNRAVEGLRIARLMMVLSSMSPIFVMWGIRGIPELPSWTIVFRASVWTISPDHLLMGSCFLLIILPNLVLYYRIQIVRRRKDVVTKTVGEATDQREHLLVYLFAMLMPLYDANLGSARDFFATAFAFCFVVFLFWHLNLHYMNLFFAIFGYRVFTVRPNNATDRIGSHEHFVVLTKRSHLEGEQQIQALRLSNSVYFEPGK